MKKKLAPNKYLSYKEIHPISPALTYKEVFKSRYQIEAPVKLFKFSILITPSTANIERGFSVLTLLLTKLHNSLARWPNTEQLD